MVGQTWRRIIVGAPIILVGLVALWYLVTHHPSANLANPESTTELTDEASLTGTDDNAAELENVTIEADGTIQLAPAQE